MGRIANLNEAYSYVDVVRPEDGATWNGVIVNDGTFDLNYKGQQITVKTVDGRWVDQSGEIYLVELAD